MPQLDPITAATAYRQALEAIASSAADGQVARRRAQQALVITFARPKDEQVVINSGLGGRTQTPYVTFGMSTPVVQVTTAQARALAHQILAAADAAESDAFVLAWLGNGASPLDERQRALLLMDFRAFREKMGGGSE